MESSRARMFFTSLHMRHWRNFKGPVGLTLKRRAFLIGPNAAGKSNVLDALRFLRDISGRGLQEAVRVRGGMAEIRTLHATRPAGLELHVAVGDDDAPEMWEYRLDLRNHPQRHLPAVLKEQVKRQGNTVLERPDASDGRDPARLTQTHLEQISANQRFRELRDFFASIRYLHIVPHLVREPERSLGRANDPFGGDFLEKVAATPARTREARLRRINEALKLAIPQFDGLELSQDARGIWHLETRFQHWRRRSARQNERSFSDGSLRLIGLLWSLSEGGGPLLLEEPELSLHDALVRRLPGVMAKMHIRSGRQVLVTTHSAALLGDPGVGLDEVHVLRPTQQGTAIDLAANMADVRTLVESDMPLGEILMPKAAPSQADLFDLQP